MFLPRPRVNRHVIHIILSEFCVCGSSVFAVAFTNVQPEDCNSNGQRRHAYKDDPQTNAVFHLSLSRISQWWYLDKECKRWYEICISNPLKHTWDVWKCYLIQNGVMIRVLTIDADSHPTRYFDHCHSGVDIVDVDSSMNHMRNNSAACRSTYSRSASVMQNPFKRFGTKSGVVGISRPTVSHNLAPLKNAAISSSKYSNSLCWTVVECNRTLASMCSLGFLPSPCPLLTTESTNPVSPKSLSCS